MSFQSKPIRKMETPTELEHDGNELPEGWVMAKLQDITTKVGSGSTPRGGSESYHLAGVPLIRSMNVRFEGFTREGLVFLDDKQAETLREATVNTGDVLLNITGASIGRVTQVPSDLDGAKVNQHVCIIRTVPTVDPMFLAGFLSSPRVQEMIWTEQYGVTRQALTKGQILAFDIPLAPLAEQRRIVGKLELLLGKVTSSQKRLSRVPKLLKRFRQSVLAAACSGKLTADWREENPQSASTHTNSGNDIPESWGIATVRDVISGLKYGTSKKCDYPAVGVPVLRIPNIAVGVIDQSDLKYTELEPAEFEQLRLRTGDVLLIRSNGSVSLVGKTALVRDSEKDFAYAGYLIRLRPDMTKITPEFLNSVLGSFDVRMQIEIPARSTSGVNNINSEEVRALRIPLPSIPEQKEIVRRVTNLFAFADQIEARLKLAQSHVDRLTQSILAKAFRGELVATEAAIAKEEGRDYEPANDLIERIRISHNEIATKRQRR